MSQLDVHRLHFAFTMLAVHRFPIVLVALVLLTGCQRLLAPTPNLYVDAVTDPLRANSPRASCATSSTTPTTVLSGAPLMLICKRRALRRSCTNSSRDTATALTSFPGLRST